MKKFSILILLFSISSKFVFADTSIGTGNGLDMVPNIGLNIGTDLSTGFGAGVGVDSEINSGIDAEIYKIRPVENVVKDKFDMSQDAAIEKQAEVKSIDFNFKDTDLIDVINVVAQARGENIILPVGEQIIKQKVNIETPEKLSIDEAWGRLNTLLDVAGYAICLDSNMSKIIKKDDNLIKNPFRIFKEEQDTIFVNTHYENIPDTDERIIFIGYFENIQVPQEQQSGMGGGAEGPNIIQSIIEIYTKAYKFVPAANGAIIVDKASNIRAMMKIFRELDKAGFKEHIEKIKLENVSAVNVEKMFKGDDQQPGGILGQKQKNTYRLGKKRKSKTKYFDKETKVVAEAKSNSLILLGNKESIDRIKEFIYKFIDIPIEGGRSVLHRKKLDYLDCNSIRDVLLKVVGSQGEEGSQSRAGVQAGGPEKFFGQVLIETDRPKAQEGSSSEKGKFQYSGTNSLLIASNNDDFSKINELIEKLDKPLRQVIVEVLIVDLTLDGNKQLGSQTRNPALAPLFNISQNGRPIGAQSAQLTKVVTNVCAEGTCVAQKTLAGDLMQNLSLDPEKGNPFTLGAVPGSTLFTISDKNGSTWSVLKILDLYNNTKILSHPYIVAINNKSATVKVGIQKMLKGDVDSTQSAGTARVNITPVNANIEVTVTPKIRGLDASGKNSVNLHINIKIEEFLDNAPVTLISQEGTNTRTQREIATNANIADDEILALGGLIRIASTNTEGKTPILGSIPIIGWFFKSRAAEKVKNNLTVFVRATVVEPAEVKGKMEAYTRDYINTAKRCSKEGGLFEELRDPVTRWFFGSDIAVDDSLDDFVSINKKAVSTEELFLADSNSLNISGSENTKIAQAGQNSGPRNRANVRANGHVRNNSPTDNSIVVAQSDLSMANLNNGGFAQSRPCSNASAMNGLSRNQLSQNNLAECDLVQDQIKDDQEIICQNSYELIEDNSRQDELFENGLENVDRDLQRLALAGNSFSNAANVNVDVNNGINSSVNKVGNTGINSRVNSVASTGLKSKKNSNKNSRKNLRANSSANAGAKQENCQTNIVNTANINQVNVAVDPIKISKNNGIQQNNILPQENNVVLAKNQEIGCRKKGNLSNCVPSSGISDDKLRDLLNGLNGADSPFVS